MNPVRKPRTRRGLSVAPPPKKRSAVAEFFAYAKEWWRAILIVYDQNIKTVLTILWTIVLLIPVLWFSGIFSRTRVEIVVIDCRVTDCNTRLKEYVTELRNFRK